MSEPISDPRLPQPILGLYPCQNLPQTFKQPPLLALLPVLSIQTHVTCSSSNLTCTQCDALYVEETRNSLSTRMNGHQFSMTSLDDLPILVTVYTKSHKLLFNFCSNVHVLQNLPLDINHIICHHLEVVYQFILSP